MDFISFDIEGYMIMCYANNNRITTTLSWYFKKKCNKLRNDN